MSTILEKIQNYFQNNSLEQIQKDWAELDKFNDIGPTVSEFLKQQDTYLLEQHKFKYEIILPIGITKNPKFTSDFFLISN